MADTATVTRKELLDFIKDFVAEQYREHGRSTHGSVLADAIRQGFPGFSFDQVGIERLADAVTRAEEEGLVRRNRSVSHLDVLPGPSSGVDMAGPQTSLRGRSQFIRPELWRAFVFVTSNQHHYMDRISGGIRPVPSDDDAAVRTHDADSQYIRIPPIPADEQQAWLRKFIESQNGLSADEAPFNEPQWWVNVPQWLREKDPELERAWRRQRSRQVLGVVKKWAEEGQVAEKLLYLSPRARTVHKATEDESVTRIALLAALGEMPLHELENLSIPVRYVIRHFRVR